jgi:predicted alpha/beta-fold hydrolase
VTACWRVGVWWVQLLAASTVTEFIRGHALFAGYKSTEEYMAQCDPMTLFRGNATPTLILSARDDPVCLESRLPDDALIDDGTAKCPYVLLVTDTGSHVAYLEGVWGSERGSYLERLTMDWFEAHRRHAEWQRTLAHGAPGTVQVAVSSP